MGRPRLSKEREQSAVRGGTGQGERKEGWGDERPRGSGGRRTGVRRAERGAGAEGQARRARARAACGDGRETVGRGGRSGSSADGTGRARVSSRLEGGGGLLTEQHQARSAASQGAIHQAAKGEVDRRLPLRVHAELGGTSRHSARFKWRTPVATVQLCWLAGKDSQTLLRNHSSAPALDSS